jgi:hypothetical protein
LASLAVFCECGGCPDGWTEVPRPNAGRRPSAEIECVMLHTEKADWYRAKAICVSQDSNVLEINSKVESDFMLSLTKKLGGESNKNSFLFFVILGQYTERETE